MAIYPNNFTNKDVLSPGARGETFQASLPGYRDGADRINRTNMNLNTNAHDVPNIKWELDRRLPPLFKYGFAYGFNQIVLPKGRVVAVDPYMNTINTEMMDGQGVDPNTGVAFKMPKSYNTLTLANGGVPVRLREDTDIYPAEAKYVAPDMRGQKVNGVGREWIPIVGLEKAYDPKASCYKPAGERIPSEQMEDAGYKIGEISGKVELDGVILNNVRPGNVPVGIIQRNEYTRDDDAFNGIMPGAVLTDAMIELPWFGFKDRAEQNPWGSAYGDLYPGALVKSDENGRITISPLSYPEQCNNFGVLTEYELERQQVIGQVYSVNRDLLPEGAARWATWALADRRNFRDFNPDEYRKTNRNGEDNTMNSAYHTTGEYPGYPYDSTVLEHDLHMLESNRPYSGRMPDQYQFDNLGIPGLTDGKNAVKRVFPWQDAVTVSEDKNATEYVDVYMRVSEVDVENLMIKIDDGDAVACIKDAVVTAKSGDGEAKTFAVVKFADALQGLVVLSIRDAAVANEYMEAKKAADPAAAAAFTVKFKFEKRGVSGVPTFMDWDGCMGSVKILLTK